MSKITKATFKSFIRKNKGELFISVRATFDGMVDCVTSAGDNTFKLCTENNEFIKNQCGITGVWLVGGSRDYFNQYKDTIYEGIEVSNCCGSFILVKAI